MHASLIQAGQISIWLQLSTLAGYLLAGLSIWGGLNTDYWPWGLAGASFIMGGHTLALTFEFILLRWIHGDDPILLQPSGVQLFRAWLGEIRTVYTMFCWRQPFRSQRWPDHLPADALGRRGLLLVHGFACNRGLWNAWLQRLTAQNTPMVAVNLEPVLGSIDEGLAIIEQAVQRLESHTGLAPVIVAHSMGGLAVRRWWAEPGNEVRVHHAVTMGTPHHGTWLARFAVTRNGRQMRQNSSWLRALYASEPADRPARLTCFYSHCDNIVFPPHAATLSGADNRHLPGVAHMQMVDQPEPWQEVQRWLAAPIRH